MTGSGHPVASLRRSTWALLLLSGLVATPAVAGPFTIIAKGAKLAGKGAAGAGKAGAASKAGVALKGAKLAGAGVAAEQVFKQVPHHADRVAVFVGRSDDGVRAVLRGADDLPAVGATGERQVGGLLADLDDMARIKPGAGVDVYLDPRVVRELPSLPAGDRTRLWIARADGPPVPVETLVRGGEPVVVGRLGPKLALKALQDASHLSTLGRLGAELVGSQVVVPEALPCAEALRGEVVAAGFAPVLGPDPTGGAVVTFHPDPGLEAWAAAQGLDLVVLGVGDVCAADEGGLRVGRHLADLADAEDWEAVWSLGSTEEAPAVVVDAELREEVMEVTVEAGTGWTLRTSLALTQPEPARDPPGLLSRMAAGLCVGLVVIACLLLQFFPRHLWNLLRHGRFVREVA